MLVSFFIVLALALGLIVRTATLSELNLSYATVTPAAYSAIAASLFRNPSLHSTRLIRSQNR
jgi:hypothetical protein